MSKQSLSKSEFVVCINNAAIPPPGVVTKIYRTVPDPTLGMEGDIRSLMESGED